MVLRHVYQTKDELNFKVTAFLTISSPQCNVRSHNDPRLRGKLKCTDYSIMA